MKSHFLILLLVASLPLTGQLQFHSFQAVMQYADAHAVAIKQSLVNEQLAAAGKREAQLNLLPTVNTSLGYNDNIVQQATLVPAQLTNPAAEEGTLQSLTFGTKFSYSANLQLQWDVLNFQKIFAYKTARIDLEKSAVNTQLNRYHTYNQLASTYYSILLIQSSERIFSENTEVSRELVELATTKYAEGLISEAELNLTKIKHLQNQQNLKQAQSNLAQYEVQLQSQLNTDQVITILDDFERFVLPQTDIMTVHPEVLWQRSELDRSQSMLKQTKAMRYPTLSLVYQNANTWATNGFMDFATANELPQQFFGVQINMSGLFSGATKQKVKQAERQLEIQQLQYDNTRLVKQKEDELLQLQFQQAAEQLAENKEILALQARNDVHADNQYQAGLLSLDQRLDRYDDLLMAQNSYLESLGSFTIAQYKIYTRQLNYQPKTSQ